MYEVSYDCSPNEGVWDSTESSRVRYQSVAIENFSIKNSTREL